MSIEDKIREEFDETTPWNFAEAILGLNLYDWQGEVIDAFEKKTCFYSLLAANNAGKTSSIIAPLVWYFASLYSNCTIVTTSSSFNQLETQMWKNILQFKHIFPDVAHTKTSLRFKNGSTVDGLSTDEAGRFEGYHQVGGQPLVIIADECKSIKEPIFSAIDKCHPTHLLQVSSAGKKSGTFYKSFNNPELKFQTKRVIWKDCPHISEEYFERMKAKYKETHPYFRAMFYSEFYGEDGDVYVIPSQMLEELRASKLVKASSLKHAFIDVAAGGDETVVAVMEGNFIHPLLTFVDSNTNSAVNRCIAYLKEMAVPAERVWMDSGGIGHPMADNFDRQGFVVGRVNNGSTAFDKAYFNRGAEIWWDARKSFEDRKYILPEDEVLFEQLSSRLIDYKEGGKLGIESKADMRERGLSSPDRADAVCGVISMAKYMPRGRTMLDVWEREEQQEQEEQQRGAWTG